MQPLLRSMRPRQWTKNLVVFAGVGFSKRAFVAADFGAALLAFASFCLASSAVYLLNDLLDVELDRRHPTKRRRPLAAGLISAGQAAAAAAACAAAGLLLAAGLGRAVFLAVAGYLLLQLLYSLYLKHQVLLDVFCIAGGFLLRALSGVWVIDATLSPWLVACSTQLALFLALCKRKAESLRWDETGGAAARPSLVHYAGPGTDVMVSVVASSVLVTYSLYTLPLGHGAAPELDSRAGAPGLVWTLPFVLYGVLRYLFLVYRREQGERPEKILTSDGPLILSILGYLIVAGAVIYR